MPNPLAMTASSGGRATRGVCGGRRADVTVRTLVPPVWFLSVLCYSGLACTDSATDCCWLKLCQNVVIAVF